MARPQANLLGATKGALWPVRNFIGIAGATSPSVAPDTKGSFSGGKLRPWSNSLADYVGVQFGQLPKIGLAALCWLYTVDMEAAALSYDLSLTGWVTRIFFRDLALMLLVAGIWDWILYFSPWSGRMAPYKFNKQYPDAKQFVRDFSWTTSATLLGSVQEVLLMRWWAGGFFQRPLFGSNAEEASVPWGTNNTFFGTADTAVFTLELPGVGAVHLHEYTAGFLLWTATVLYWRVAHFHLVHRTMHPWWDRENDLSRGDIGAVLYRYVHSHHHKSYNPTAWSGLSMLPIESITYISASLIPLLFRSGCHPWIVLYTKLDLIVGAQMGHDGFDEPGGGSYFHQLHHAHFECNYGDSCVPLDWIFGTFEDGSSKAKAIGEREDIDSSLLSDYEKHTFTLEDVAKHTSKSDCWVVLNGIVLDISEFLSEHPGGEKILFNKAGRDVTAVFKQIHEKSGGFSLVDKWAVKKVGIVNDASAGQEPETESASTGQYCVAQVTLNAVFLLVCVLSWHLIMGD